jgi:hypothetical protein
MKQISISQTAENSSKKAFLLILLTEIFLMIFSLVPKHDKSIKPFRLLSKSDKFLNLKDFGKSDFSFEKCHPGLTNARLLATCKQIKNIIMGEKMIFYKSNVFEFPGNFGPREMLDYLVFLAPSRRNAIQSIVVEWTTSEVHGYHFSYLDTCQGLRQLSLDISRCYQWFWPGDNSFAYCPAYEQLMKLRGIPRVNLMCSDFSTSASRIDLSMTIWFIRWAHITDETVASLIGEIPATEKRMNEVMNSGTKADSLVTKEQIQSAIEKSNARLRA